MPFSSPKDPIFFADAQFDKEGNKPSTRMPGSDGSDFRKFHMHYSNRRCGCNDLVCYLGWDSASSIGWPIALIHACCFSNPKTAIEWSRLQSTRTTSALSTYDDISSVGTTFKMVRRRSPNSASDKGKPRASVYQMHIMCLYEPSQSESVVKSGAHHYKMRDLQLQLKRGSDGSQMPCGQVGTLQLGHQSSTGQNWSLAKQSDRQIRALNGWSNKDASRDAHRQDLRLC
jgi:hypothetical protein